MKNHRWGRMPRALVLMLAAGTVLVAGVVVSASATAQVADPAAESTGATTTTTSATAAGDSMPAPVAASTATAAATQIGGVKAYWTKPNTTETARLDQNVVVEATGPTTFWALQWWWADDPSLAAYMGLQRDGNRFDGTRGPMAIVSFWNAKAAKGPSCQTFDGEGTGWSCRAPITLKQGVRYNLVLQRAAVDSTGQWWQAWVTGGSQLTYYLGSIAMDPVHTSIGNLVNFTEFFAPPPACDALPRSSVHWGRPEGNRASTGLPHFTYTTNTPVVDDCSGGKAVASPPPYDGMLNLQWGVDTGQTQLDDNVAGNTPTKDALIVAFACKTLNSTAFGPVWHVKVVVATSDPTVMAAKLVTSRRTATGTTVLSTVQTTTWNGGFALLETDAYALPTFAATTGEQFYDSTQLSWFNKNNASDATHSGATTVGDGTVNPARPDDSFNAWNPISACR